MLRGVAGIDGSVRFSLVGGGTLRDAILPWVSASREVPWLARLKYEIPKMADAANSTTVIRSATGVLFARVNASSVSSD